MVTGPLVPMIIAAYRANGWRISWYVLSGMGFVVWLLCIFFLRNHPSEKGLQPIGSINIEKDLSTSEKNSAPLNWGAVYKTRIVWQLAAIYCAFGFFLYHLCDVLCPSPCQRGWIFLCRCRIALDADRYGVADQRFYLGRKFRPVQTKGRPIKRVFTSGYFFL